MLERIINHKEGVLATDSRRSERIQWLSARQEQSLPPPERQRTLRNLASFGEIPTEVLQDLIPKLVNQTENEGDEPTRNDMIEVLLEIFEHNQPRDQDLWMDLNDCRRRLLNSAEEPTRQLGQKLHREIRRMRRLAAQ